MRTARRVSAAHGGQGSASRVKAASTGRFFFLSDNPMQKIPVYAMLGLIVKIFGRRRLGFTSLP
jgi:hypothetical protein